MRQSRSPFVSIFAVLVLFGLDKEMESISLGIYSARSLIVNTHNVQYL